MIVVLFLFVKKKELCFCCLNLRSKQIYSKMNNSRSHHLQSFINNSLAIRQEIQRFESVHPSIYAIYDLIELIPDNQIAQQLRDHVVCIEGKIFI